MGIHKTNERYQFWILLVIGILLASLVLYFSFSKQETVSQEYTEYEQLSVTFSDREVPPLEVYIADTDQKRMVGLAAINSLGEDEGMLFFFDTDAYHSFWMKDMSYPIDIVWLDSEKNIVTIVENADPADFPSTYTPTSPARYVLEVNAGFSSQHSLEEGMQLVW